MPGSTCPRGISPITACGMKTKSADADTRRRSEEVASDVRHIAKEIRPLTDSLDSLHILLQHVWQNRDELVDLLSGFTERVTIHCEQCPSNQGVAKAITDGWKELRNEAGTFRGVCPCCNAAAKGGRERLPAEIVFCTCCHAICSTSLAEALRGGWQCIIDDEGNERGNYAGMCPGCTREEAVAPTHRVASVDEKPAQQRTFF